MADPRDIPVTEGVVQRWLVPSGIGGDRHDDGDMARGPDGAMAALCRERLRGSRWTLAMRVGLRAGVVVAGVEVDEDEGAGFVELA